MPEPATVSAIRCTGATRFDQARGIVAYVAFRFAGLRLDGIRLRRTRAGRLYLSWPHRLDRKGRRHFFASPLSPALRGCIEAQVLGAWQQEASA